MNTLISLIIIVAFFGLIDILYAIGERWKRYSDYKNGKSICGRWIYWVNFEHKIAKY
jgi:hypothetical protein